MFNGNFNQLDAGAKRSKRKLAWSGKSKGAKAQGKRQRASVKPVVIERTDRSRKPRVEDQGISFQAIPVAAAVTPELGQREPSGGSKDILEVGSVALLTIAEEIELAEQIKKGNEAARERMIRANLRLVIKIARDYENLGLPLPDLISEGIIGLMKAVDKFDPAKGGKLSTYGSWWIKQQIRRALANQGRTIRLPVHVEGKLYQLGRMEAKLRHEFGREATDEELAAELDTEPKRIGRLRNAAIRPASLDAPIGEDGSSTVAEVVADDRTATPFDHLQSKVDHGLLMQLLRTLPEREERILRFRFGLDGGEEQTLEEVGKRFGLTRERIRQLQNEAFRKLRQAMDSAPMPIAA